MLTHVNQFFTTLIGTELPVALILCITFLLVMWLFKAIMSVFGATKTKTYDYVTIMGVAYILLASLAETLSFSINFGGAS